MKSSLLISYNGEKIHITVKELLYQDHPAWQVLMPDGKQFVLKKVRKNGRCLLKVKRILISHKQ